jgi:hypothetical protein
MKAGGVTAARDEVLSVTYSTPQPRIANLVPGLPGRSAARKTMPANHQTSDTITLARVRTSSIASSTTT